MMTVRELLALVEGARMSSDVEIRLERPGEAGTVAVEGAYIEQPFLGEDRVVLKVGN